MAIQVKSGGSYADVAGVFVKQGGAYSAADVYTKVAGAYARVDAAPWTPNRIEGASFTASQIQSGVSGSYDITTNTNRIIFAAPTLSLQGATLLNFKVKGTGATLLFNRVSGSGAVGLCQVSVDGSTYTDAAVSTNTYTLFSGLSDDVHDVCVKIGTAYGTTNVYLDKLAASVLNITGGVNTYIELPSVWAQSCVNNPLFNTTGMGVANATNYTPALSKYSTLGSNIGALVIKGNFKNLFVSMAGDSNAGMYVSIDGAAPTKYASPAASSAGGHAYAIPVTTGIHTYYVWSSGKGSVFSVAGDSTPIAVSPQKDLHQFGDSITFGAGGSGGVETMRVAAAMGYAGMTAGISGHTIAQLAATIDTYLSSLTVTSNDVAVIAIGRNNTGGAFDATETTDYQSIVNKVVAKGYGKILCRGILPSGNHDTTWTAENGSIQSIVSGFSNPNVIFVDTSACPAYTTVSNDNTHPDDAGYATIAPFIEARYRAALGL